jgi:hypothetical protein
LCHHEFQLIKSIFFVLTGRGTKFPEDSRLQDQCSSTEKRSYQISSLHPRSRYFAERTKAVVSCSVLQTDRRATILQFQEELKSRTINGDSIFLCLSQKPPFPYPFALSELNAKATLIPLVCPQLIAVTPQLLSTRGRKQSLLDVDPLVDISCSLCSCLFRISLGTEKTSQSPEVPEVWFDGR